MRGKGHAVEFDRVDADVDQQLNAAVALQADGVFSLKQEATSPGNGAITWPTAGIMATPLPSRPLAKVLSGTCSRAITLPLIGARISFAEAGYRHGARCSAGARQAGEEGQHAGEHESHAGADKPAPDAGVNPAGRDHLRREKMFGRPNE